MTREEAIARIKNHKIRHKMNEPRAIYISEALDIGIEALEHDPCDDVIAFKENVLDAISKVGLFKSDTKEVQTVAECLRAVEALSPVAPQPKTGHWILTSDDDYEYCTCSECGYQNGENWMIESQIKFCQECGAKMIEPQAESEE